jgi:hypothetical protein
MSWLAPAPRPQPSSAGAHEPRRQGRLRRVDLALVIGSVIAVAVSMLFWTGVVPSALYPPSPFQWTLDAPTCTYVGEESQDIQHAFPLWATVHVRWTAIGGDVAYIVFNLGHAWPPTPISQLGTSGNGSFFSDSAPYAFEVTAFPLPNAGCTQIVVTTWVTYTI